MAWVDPIPELKRQVAAELVARMDGRNAHDMAALMGTDQPRVSDIRRGKLDRFSLEILIRYAQRLRRRAAITFTDIRLERARGRSGDGGAGVRSGS